MSVPIRGIIHTAHATLRPKRTVHVAGRLREPMPGRPVVLIERPPRCGVHRPYRFPRSHRSTTMADGNIDKPHRVLNVDIIVHRLNRASRPRTGRSGRTSSVTV